MVTNDQQPEIIRTEKNLKEKKRKTVNSFVKI